MRRRGGAAHSSNAGRHPAAEPPTISGRWLLGAVAVTLAAAVVCAWGALCLLFWQGSWQLLYHPRSAVTRTPASMGLAFDTVGFAASDAGTPQLRGWWINAPPDARLKRLTVVYLHGQDENLSNTLDVLAHLHAAGMNVLAFDYRGYGQSQFVRPSETHWRQDAEWALAYLTGTRHVAADTIVLDGTGLGANLALEVASVHPELAGVIVSFPLADATSAIFSDARARLVPARLLVRDRFDLDAAAGRVRIPVLWVTPKTPDTPHEPTAYEKVGSRKMLVQDSSTAGEDPPLNDAWMRWLDELPAH